MTALVFDRSYVSPCASAGTFPDPRPCPRCHRATALVGDPQRYCGPECHAAVMALPIPERERARAATPYGWCVRCGAEVEPPRYRCPSVRAALLRRWRWASGGQLRFGEEAYAWLAAKLGMEHGDERLADIALGLAREGRLSVLVYEGRVIGIAKAPEPDAPSVPRARIHVPHREGTSAA